MATDKQVDSESSDRFEQVLAEYLEATEAGHAADRETWLANHAEVAKGLQNYFDAVDQLSGMTRRVRQISQRAVPKMFGSYEVLEEIGRGGMGVVYRARHVRLDRIVALKLVRNGRFLDSGDQLRFQNEAEAASQLDHPNIVPIYDFGEQEGQAYLTMKWIEGQSLAELRPLEILPDGLNGRLQHEHLVRVVRDIARAVHHAHQRGILHRDLKPSNILMDQNHQAYVADFGLAKQVHRDQEITQTGAILGTPTYMAPEQTISTKENDSKSKEKRRSTETTAVDVYGLGAILYFLLTGRPPFKGETPLATLALVRDQPAALPSALNRSIDRDLDAVCRKCLEKRPRDRYESAEALAQDLERWLTGQPTLARPARQLEIVWRWCQRNRRLAGLIGTIIFLLIFGVGSLTYGIMVANKARSEAVQQRQTALANLRAVISEINDLENRRPDLDEMRLDLLTRVQKQLEPMLKDPVHGTLADETNFWLEVDAGDVLEERGEYAAASEHFEKAMAIAKRIPADSTGTQQRISSFALSHMGDSFSNLCQHDTACNYFSRCLEVRQQLARQFPTEQSRSDLGLAHLKLATGLERLAQHKGDLKMLADVIENATHGLHIFEELCTHDPTNIWYTRFIGYARSILANSELRLGHWAEAFDHSITGAQRIMGLKPSLPDYRLIVDVHRNELLDALSSTCIGSGRYQEGLAAAEESLTVRRRMADPSPGSIALWQRVLFSLERKARCLHGLGRLDEAETSFQEAFQIGEKILNENHYSHNLRFQTNNVLDDWILMLLPLREHDVKTMRLMAQRRELREKDFRTFHTDGKRAQMLFADLISEMEFGIIRGDEQVVRSNFEAAVNLLNSAQTLGVEKLSVEQIAAYTDAFAKFGYNWEELSRVCCRVSRSQGILTRLQDELLAKSDADSLAITSIRMSASHTTFRDCLSGLRGMAKALPLLPDGPLKEQTQDALSRELEYFRSFGDHAGQYLDFEIPQ